MQPVGQKATKSNLSNSDFDMLCPDPVIFLRDTVMYTENNFRIVHSFVQQRIAKIVPNILNQQNFTKI